GVTDCGCVEACTFTERGYECIDPGGDGQVERDRQERDDAEQSGRLHATCRQFIALPDTITRNKNQKGCNCQGYAGDHCEDALMRIGGGELTANGEERDAAQGPDHLKV